jgi:hypothetical protein
MFLEKKMYYLFLGRIGGDIIDDDKSGSDTTKIKNELAREQNRVFKTPQNSALYTQTQHLDQFIPIWIYLENPKDAYSKRIQRTD